MLQPISLTLCLSQSASCHLRVHLSPTWVQRYSALVQSSGMVQASPAGTPAPVSTVNVLAQAVAFKNSAVALRRRPRWRGSMA
jgi:hypothetical protein